MYAGKRAYPQFRMSYEQEHPGGEHGGSRGMLQNLWSILMNTVGIKSGNVFSFLDNRIVTEYNQISDILAIDNIGVNNSGGFCVKKGSKSTGRRKKTEKT